MAEMLTKSRVWLTSAFQCRRTRLLKFPVDFMERLDPTTRNIVYQNIATRAVSLWLTGRRDEQEYLIRMDMSESEIRQYDTESAGRQENNATETVSYADERTEEKKYAILRFLNVVARRVRNLPAAITHGRVTDDRVYVYGPVERLSWYIGMRKTNISRAWEALQGKRKVNGKARVIENLKIIEGSINGYAS